MSRAGIAQAKTYNSNDNRANANKKDGKSINTMVFGGLLIGGGL
jgi:hypothetical protein